MSVSYLKGSQEALSQAYRLALLDLDGVVYRGSQPVEHAAQAISMASGHGMQMVYTTNNPSRYPSVVAQQLRSYGIELSDSQVITSATVGARMLRKHLPAGAAVYVIGSDHLRDELRANDLRVVQSNRDQPEAVIQSWYPELTLNDLAQAAYAIENGARYFVTNRDLTIPREDGIAPGNGAMQLPVIAASGKEPEDSAGKPEPGLYDVARGLFSDDGKPMVTQVCLPIGDRLDTDIEAAYKGGYDSAVVLTGVATPEAILQAEVRLRPSYILADLRGLQDAQPQPVKAPNGSWVCCSCTAQVVDGRLQLSAHDAAGKELDPLLQLDAVRAAACACWEATDAGVDMSRIDIPVFHISE
ncbi:haloacid dehalogenase [Bombiscardovia apis]|uniref:Haloacid dehalogenase n=1 Tax=Bombiscardovia apis TaxID=2932182 RepID=A0ABM8BD92_9BIFI|nr:HAD-IIA family hydrolase [Bombiscardovia apis]BDR54872.1 haloacid dehalogenase [Bombiscardovia apis]